MFLRRGGQGGHLGARTNQSQTLLGHPVHHLQRLESREQEDFAGEGEEARTSQSQTLLGLHVQRLEFREIVGEAKVVVVGEGGDVEVEERLCRNHSLTLSQCLAQEDLAISLPHWQKSAMSRRFKGNSKVLYNVKFL